MPIYIFYIKISLTINRKMDWIGPNCHPGSWMGVEFNQETGGNDNSENGGGHVETDLTAIKKVEP